MDSKGFIQRGGPLLNAGNFGSTSKHAIRCYFVLNQTQKHLDEVLKYRNSIVINVRSVMGHNLYSLCTFIYKLLNWKDQLELGILGWQSLHLGPVLWARLQNRHCQVQ